MNIWSEDTTLNWNLNQERKGKDRQFKIAAVQLHVFKRGCQRIIDLTCLSLDKNGVK